MSENKTAAARVDWEECVKKAKKKLGVPVSSWGIVQGKVLKVAMRYYCEMGY
jgi:hypothetical protein